MGHYIVERFVPGATTDDVKAWAEALEISIRTLDVRGEITHLGSELMNHDETCLCFFDATDAGLVRKVNDHAGTPYERVLDGQSVRKPTEGKSE